VTEAEGAFAAIDAKVGETAGAALAAAGSDSVVMTAERPDYVSKLEREPDPEIESGFYMWWDLILHGFWNSSRPAMAGTYRGDASKLDAESRVLLDVLFETLTRILAIPNRASQQSALHGLGHLYHPHGYDAVQRFIDTNPSGFSLEWLEQCRDCRVM
jgi:hypothetical protein